MSVCAHRKWGSPFLCVLVVLISARALAGGVLVLKGPNTQPFQEALSGFRRAYSGGNEIDKREFSRRLQADHPALLVAFGREAAELAHQQAADIPLIVVMVSDPAAFGLTGKKVAGITTALPGDLQLRLFNDLLPNNKSIALIHNPARSGTIATEAQAAARKLGVHVEDVPVNSPREVRDRFNLVKPPIVNAVWVVPDEDTKSVWAFLLEETGSLKLPLVFTNGEEAVRDGALAALTPDFRDIGRQCGDLVQQIASGKATIADIGFRPPEKARWVVNTKTAGKIGVVIRRDILDSAKTYP